MPRPSRRWKRTLIRPSSGARSVTRTSAPADEVNASTLRMSSPGATAAFAVAGRKSVSASSARTRRPCIARRSSISCIGVKLGKRRACAALSRSPPPCSRLAAAPAGAATCPNQDAVRVPGAERQVADCLDDLTTKGTVASGHTDRSDWQTLHSSASRNPDKVVPGLQVDGYFPDTLDARTPTAAGCTTRSS